MKKWKMFVKKIGHYIGLIKSHLNNMTIQHESQYNSGRAV